MRGRRRWKLEGRSSGRATRGRPESQGWRRRRRRPDEGRGTRDKSRGAAAGRKCAAADPRRALADSLVWSRPSSGKSHHGAVVLVAARNWSPSGADLTGGRVDQSAVGWWILISGERRAAHSERPAGGQRADVLSSHLSELRRQRRPAELANLWPACGRSARRHSPRARNGAD